MYGLRKLLQMEQIFLEKILSRTEAELNTLPPEHLRISRSKDTVQYYKHQPKSKSKKGTYLSKKNQTLIQQLAQRTYDEKLIEKAHNRLRQLEELLADYQDDEMDQIYLDESPERRGLVQPFRKSWEQILDEWQHQKYIGKTFEPGTKEYYTEKGERVRSKSEQTLANYFFYHQIPYLYEKPIQLKGIGTVYPDFTFLSPRTRKEIYWEHEGMMDLPAYARTAVRKINAYEATNIFPGERLILTWETDETVLDTRLVEALCKKYLL